MSNKVRLTPRTISAESPDGYTVEFDIAVYEQESGIDAVNAAIERLKKAGYTPAIAAAPVGMTPEYQTSADVEASTFMAERLTVTADDGKFAYKIKGGMFQKWGVRVWPETLQAAGINVGDIDPLNGMQLDGMIAHFVEKEGGSPHKVTRLARLN